uniref:non-specific protein-tyrosine kinase n=1 Tax=Tursiops truncatus TaxID=9739 RepID=A0A6J3RCI5_TURTR|nr:activated CDC42 kinase 1 isoform X21 [Tursiops truncatus]
MQPEEGTGWLLELLSEVQLQQYFLRLRDDLNVTRLSHFEYVKNEDLEKIGMGRPGQRRLWEAVKRRKAMCKRKSWMSKDEEQPTPWGGWRQTAPNGQPRDGARAKNGQEVFARAPRAPAHLLGCSVESGWRLSSPLITLRAPSGRPHPPPEAQQQRGPCRASPASLGRRTCISLRSWEMAPLAWCAGASGTPPRGRRAENYWWRGQNTRTLCVGPFPRNVVTSVAGLSAQDISQPLQNSFIHTGHGDSDPRHCWGFPDRIDELYLGNPMDPPDLLSVELSTSRPTQHLGRVKREPPPRPPQPAIFTQKPTYDPVSEDQDPLSSDFKRLGLRKPGLPRGLWLAKPSARVPGTKAGRGSSEVTLIDFGEEPVVPAPRPCAPSLAQLAMDACSLLDKTPPQSPSRALPRPLHPTPVVDWDARPLPPPPAYDDVAQDEDDFEVCSINSTLVSAGLSAGPSQGETNYAFVPEPARLFPALEDNLFLPPQGGGKPPNSAQTAEIFQALQQECMRQLQVPAGSLVPSPSPVGDDKPQVPPRVPIPPRPTRPRGELSPAPSGEEETGRWPGPASPPRVPPREPLSPQGSRTPSPLVPRGSSPLPPRLSSSPGKTMPTTQSFASDPKYATPQVIQAPGPRAGPCILPIVRDGKKVSSTHYYLLPERPPYLERYQRFLRETRSPEEPTPMPVPLLLPPPGISAPAAPTATVRPMPQAAPDPKANFSTNTSNSGAQLPALRATARLPQRGCPGDGPEAGRPAEKIQMLQAMVHGVTTEECQAALQSHSWSVQRAAQYLKVEQLFGLGLRPRGECHKVLEMFDWNLEQAGCHLLGSCGPAHHKR